MKQFADQLTADGIQGRERVKLFNQFCKNHLREGKYLIKVSRKNAQNYCGEDKLYIDYTYTAHGWFALSKRANAQWFTAKEAAEFVSLVKGFQVVKN
jgi:hypothetical protein